MIEDTLQQPIDAETWRLEGALQAPRHFQNEFVRADRVAACRDVAQWLKDQAERKGLSALHKLANEPNKPDQSHADEVLRGKN